MSRRLVTIAIAFVLSLTGGALLTAGAAAANDPECTVSGPDEIAICDEFLEHWEANGGEETIGMPLTPEMEEVDPVTQESLTVQYFEYARMEHHPELEDTDYAVQLGRLGSEVLSAEGIDWEELPAGDSDDPFYAEPTGQVVAPEFQEFWSEHGLELGDDDVSYRESLALFGYPLTPAEEIDTDEGAVLSQWFERARLEIDDAGEVSAVPLGLEMNDDAQGLSLRVQGEIEGALAEVSDAHDSPGLGVWLESSELGDWEWSLGYADPESEEPYALDTHHRIGSVTKPIVGNVVLQLVDEGLLALDDTVDQWFPELDGTDEVTVQMLGNMTSGIFNYTEALPWLSAITEDPEQVWTPEELLEIAFDMTGTVEPDETWAYSNTNYVMLGLIIEELTGNDLVDELEDRVFSPLGMTDTSYPPAEDTSMPEPHARGLSSMGLISVDEDTTDWNTSWGHAAGQIVSTPEDMLVWAPEMFDSELLSAEMNAAQLDLVDVLPSEVLEDEAEDIDDEDEAGYGFGVLRMGDWYGHDGLIFGYTTMVVYHPELDASLVIFGNSDELSSDGTVAIGAAYAEIQQILEREYSALEHE